MTAGRLPTFLVIGAQKAATSTIYTVLDRHPQVAMARKTEVHFFDDAWRYARGLEHYASFFESGPETRAVGEVTPAYLRDPAVPGRIRESLPDVRLVASLRDPVERAYSAWRMARLTGSERAPFGEALRETPAYVDNGAYHAQLSRYLDRFPQDRLLVLLYDDLIADGAAFFGRLFGFIGVSEIAIASPPRVLSGSEPRFDVVPRLLNLAFRARNRIRDSALGPLVDNPWIDRGSRRLRNRIANLNRAPTPTPSGPDRDAARYVVERLADDIEALERLLGRDLGPWRRRGAPEGEA